MNISVITIAYEGYGKYLSNLVGSILKQKEKPKEIIIVLSKNHRMLRLLPDEIEGIKIKVIYKPERVSMGELWNIAIREASSKWILKIDADDVLLKNTIKDIKKLSRTSDAILLTYLKKEEGLPLETRRTPRPDIKDFENWREIYSGASGYVAFKKRFNKELILCEENDFPNFPLLMKIEFLGMRISETKNPCAVYKKNNKGHSSKISKENRHEAYKIIRSYAEDYYKKTMI